jgi:hypothetical protein
MTPGIFSRISEIRLLARPGVVSEAKAASVRELVSLFFARVGHHGKRSCVSPAITTAL